MLINCQAPEGNALCIIATVTQFLRSNNVPDDVVRFYADHMMSSASYWELLDAVITITQGEVDFINIPHKN